MSYCRFSSDDFQCDVYAYHDCGGYYQVYVADNRADLSEPLPPKVEWEFDGDNAGYFERHTKVMDIIEKSERKKIGLPFDGESYQLPGLVELAAKLKELKAAGYNVPDYAFGVIQDELEALELGE